MEGVATLFSGALGAAIAAGIFGLMEYKLRKKDAQAAAKNADRKALRYLMLYIIEERCKEHINEGNISVDELRNLHKWHELYHEGLGGNGDADQLLKKVEALRLDTEN